MAPAKERPTRPAGVPRSTHSLRPAAGPLEAGRTAEAADREREAEQEIRRREVVGVRETLRRGIEAVEADLDAQRWSAARERLDPLQELAMPFHRDLIDEVASLRALDRKITSSQVSAKATALIRQDEETAWQRRVQEIRSLIREKSYPEAKKLAARLADEPGAPESITSLARELGAQADQELKRIFGKTIIGPNTSEVVKKPPPPA